MTTGDYSTKELLQQVREEWGEAIFSMVPGHEIAGIVKEVGSEVTKFKPGMRAGVGVFIDSCRKCENCLAGENQYCLEGMTGTYNGYERDGKFQNKQFRLTHLLDQGLVC